MGSLFLWAGSLVLFFGFVVWCVCKFGLLSCYSAYGPEWEKITKPNVWSIVTFATAFMLVPVLLDCSDGNPWQFTAFICPASILFVALTPDYGTNKLAGIVHIIGASIGAIFSILVVVFVFPQLWWLILVYLVVATIAAFVTGFKEHWDFWYEMAAYALIYTAVGVMLIKYGLKLVG